MASDDRPLSIRCVTPWDPMVNSEGSRRRKASAVAKNRRPTKSVVMKKNAAMPRSASAGAAHSTAPRQPSSKESSTPGPVRVLPPARQSRIAASSRQRSPPTPDFAAVTAGNAQERAQRLQASAPVAQAQIQMVHVSPEPAAANAHAVVSAFGHTLPRRAADEQRREVDPGVDGQLQRPPESPVHLHDHLPARLRL